MPCPLDAYSLRREDGCWRETVTIAMVNGSHLGSPLTHFTQKLQGI